MDLVLIFVVLVVTVGVFGCAGDVPEPGDYSSVGLLNTFLLVLLIRKVISEENLLAAAVLVTSSIVLKI